MKKLIALLLLCMPLLALAGDPEAVAKAFADYKAAILQQKGDAAVGLVTKRTVDDYQNYVDWALRADRRTVESLSLINRFQVFLLRHRIPPATLARLDGRSVFVYAVDRDWIGKNGVIRTTLGKVEVASHRATADAVIGGHTAPAHFQFAKENGRWKLDLAQLSMQTEWALKAVARQKGMTEDALLFSLLETATGSRVGEAIWNPVGP